MTVSSFETNKKSGIFVRLLNDTIVYKCSTFYNKINYFFYYKTHLLAGIIKKSKKKKKRNVLVSKETVYHVIL